MNCGSCGTTCPGYQATRDNVTCAMGTDCTFSCQGEAYDVDGAADDGCEVSDATEANHTQASAVDVGPITSCETGGADVSLSGELPSDDRVHEHPVVDGFDATTGAAPDWFSFVPIDACSADLALTLTVTGSTSPACYALGVVTDLQSFGCQATSGGACSVVETGTAYTPGNPILVSVRKTCGTSVAESASYTVTGHL